MSLTRSELFNFIQGSTITGESVYDIWKSLNPNGTEQEFIDSIKGKSAYEYWSSLECNAGKTEEDFMQWLGTDNSELIANETTNRKAADDKVLSDSKYYTDSKISTEVNARKAGDAQALTDAKAYTDSSVHSESIERESGDTKALSDANAYTDKQINEEKTNRETADTTNLAEAKSYTDTKVASLSSNLTSHTGNTSNPHKVTKSQVGLGNVENKSSETIRGELTKENVTKALGYTPPTTNTTYSDATQTAHGLMSTSDKIKVDEMNNVPFIVGTQTAQTGTWVGIASTISTLKDGQTIRFWLPFSGSGNATLNLTLKDGTTTGAKNCYYKATERLTTHFPAGSVISFTYRENVSVNGSSTTYTGWWADASYNSDTYDRIRYQQPIKCGSTAITHGNIITGKDGVYGHLKSGNAFDITYPILYCPTNISVSGTYGYCYIQYYFDIRTTQSITLTGNKPVYIKGTLAGTIFTPISTTPITQTIPTSADGYTYILLGMAYSSTGLYLLPQHPIFAFKNGSFGEVSVSANYADTAGSVAWGNVTGRPSSMPASDVSSWAKASTKPTYTKSEVGLSNVDNTADSAKPVSTAQATAIADAKKAGTDAQTNLTSHIGDTSNPHKVTKSQVGLGNVENKSSETIRGELTKENVTKALGYTPYTPNEVDNKISALETNIDWKESVATYADIATTYPTPDDGWTVNVKDTDYTYRYNGTEWVTISANAIPKATNDVDGLLSKEDHTNFADANSKKHTHTNKSVLDGITSALITAWNDAVTHSSKTSGNPHNVTKSDVGLGNVGNFKAVSTVASQGLTDTEKANARANIGAGASSFSGSYNDLSNKPTIPTVDSALSSTSTNAIQNKAVKTALDGKVDLSSSGVSAAITKLSRGTSTPVDDDYYVAQASNGGTTDNSYYRKPVSTLFDYIKSKLATVAVSGSYNDLKDKPTDISGNAESATKLKTARKINVGTAASGTATAFDGTADINIPITSVKEAYLEWGGKNLSGTYGPIDAAMVPQLGANRLAFIPPESVEIEYSRDSGSTWNTYSTTDLDKKVLFGGNGYAKFYIGADNSTEIDKSKYQVRITVTASTANVYTELTKFVIYISNGGSTDSWCSIDAKTKANVDSGTDTWKTLADKAAISGWDGYNVINVSKFVTYGNSSSQYEKIRFTFGVTSHASSVKYAGLCIEKIMGFGGASWRAPSTMAKFGNLYEYDANQNATFPNNVSAKTFYGTFSGNASTATALSSSAGSGTQPIYFKDGKPVITTYTLGKSVPSDAKFTDTDTWKANSASSEGYVASGSGQVNKLWKTDANGVPAWRSITASDVGLSKAIISGSQTSTSTADGGSNVYTFTDVSGNTSTITVKNGTKGSTGATGTRGSRWTTGTAITGTSTTATIFSSSGITDALVNDMYLNTSSATVYKCTVAGAASAAKWVYVGSIKGATGSTGSAGARGSRWNVGTAITGTSTTATAFSSSGITDALVNDMYLNTSTSYVYRCTVAGNASTAKWVYVQSIKGATGSKGDKGDTGAAGKGISSAAVTYQASSSGTTIPTGTWNSTIPSTSAGQYLWTRTIVTYTDNTTTTSYSVSRNGSNGTNGTNGTTPTIKVAAGENINAVGTPTVSASTSGTTTTLTFNYLKGAQGEKGTAGTNATTTSVFGTSANGLAPKSDGSTSKYLRADGTWQTPPDNNTTYSTFVKSGSGAKSGLVPAPSTTAGTTKYLREDGTWQTPPDNNTTYSTFVKSGSGAKSGLVPAPSTTAGTTKYLREDGTWQTPPDNNTTYSDFVKSGSGAKSGLVPAPSTTAGTTKYLREDGTWQTPPNTTYSAMTAATASAAGKTGLVPAPAAGKQEQYLRGDGTWADPFLSVFELVSTVDD